jgi:HTH-type transcriptional regulator/antitoxin HigA
VEVTVALDEKRYGDLLKSVRPHVIRDRSENEKALRQIEAFMSRGDALSAEEREVMDLLVALVEKFESDHYALSAAPPAEILRELLAARNLKQKDVVDLFPSKGVASEVLAGKRSISKSQAKRLAAFFHVSPALFI